MDYEETRLKLPFCDSYIYKFKLMMSLQLCVESSLKLEVDYYNEKLTVWEPLIEPIVDGGKIRPWELSLDVSIIFQYIYFKGILSISH